STLTRHTATAWPVCAARTRQASFTWMARQRCCSRTFPKCRGPSRCTSTVKQSASASSRMRSCLSPSSSATDNNRETAEGEASHQVSCAEDLKARRRKFQQTYELYCSFRNGPISFDKTSLIYVCTYTEPNEELSCMIKISARGTTHDPQ